MWASQESHQASLALPLEREAIANGRPLIAGLSHRTDTSPSAGALWSTIRPAAGESVSYSQGATTVTATAVPGSSPIVSETNDGAIRTDKTQDFIFKAADLLGVVPQRGDTITWGSTLNLPKLSTPHFSSQESFGRQ